MSKTSLLVGFLLACGTLSVSTIEASAQSIQDCWDQYSDRPDDYRDHFIPYLSNGTCSQITVPRTFRGNAGQLLRNGAIRYSDGTYAYVDQFDVVTAVQSDGAIKAFRNDQWEVIFQPNANDSANSSANNNGTGGVLMGIDVFEADVRASQRQREEGNRNKGARSSGASGPTSSSVEWGDTIQKDQSAQNSNKWGNQSNANSGASTDKWGNPVSSEQGGSSTNKWGSTTASGGSSGTDKWGNTATSDSNSGTDKWGNPVSGEQGASSTNKWGDSPSSGASESTNKWGQPSNESGETRTDKFGNSPSDSQSDSSGKWGSSSSDSNDSRLRKTNDESNGGKEGKNQ